jgi:hypothetical protein
MSKQILLERFTKPLFELLDETFEQVHGNYLDGGTSLFQTLEHVSAEEASRPVSGKCATLATQVKHVRFYLCVLQDHILKKDVRQVDWQDIWRTTKQVTPEESGILKGQLKETYQSVRAMLGNLDAWEGENDISGSLGILVHTACHLGEIRQALCVVK